MVVLCLEVTCLNVEVTCVCLLGLWPIIWLCCAVCMQIYSIRMHMWIVVGCIRNDVAVPGATSGAAPHAIALRALNTKHCKN